MLLYINLIKQACEHVGMLKRQLKMFTGLFKGTLSPAQNSL